MSAALRRETPPDQPATRALRKEVRELLERGGIAVLPTETVYGLAARADDEAALQRLLALKSRPDGKGLTWHVGSRAALESFDELAGIAGRLAERHWPGPLTLVLSGVPEALKSIALEGWTGVRFPAHAALASLLDFAPFPIVMTSANRSGAAPAVEASAAEATFGDEVDLYVDSGRCSLSESSVVLKVGPGRFEVLREGLLELDALKRSAGLNIGFVCTGNTCRSPMAETLARAVLGRRLATPGENQVVPPEIFGFRIGSAGVYAGTGSPASEHAVTVMGENGLDLSCHGSQPATPELLRDWDRVYCLTSSHREALVANLPPSRSRHIALLDPDGRDVPDPIGGSLDDYRACARSIERSLEQRVEEWV